MTFKTGAVVMLLRSHNPLLRDMIGQVHTLGKHSSIYTDSWLLEGVLFSDNKFLVSWKESCMRVLGSPGDDAVDETLLRLPSPRQEVTA